MSDRNRFLSFKSFAKCKGSIVFWKVPELFQSFSECIRMYQKVAELVYNPSESSRFLRIFHNVSGCFRKFQKLQYFTLIRILKSFRMYQKFPEHFSMSNKFPEIFRILQNISNIFEFTIKTIFQKDRKGSRISCNVPELVQNNGTRPNQVRPLVRLILLCQPHISVTKRLKPIKDAFNFIKHYDIEFYFAHFKVIEKCLMQ